MKCPQCGNEFADDLHICPECGAEVSADAVGEEESSCSQNDKNTSESTSAISQCACHRQKESADEIDTGKHCRCRRIGFAAGIILLLLVIAAIAYYVKKSAAPASLESLVPKDCAMVAAADAAWWWNTSEDVRLDPQVVREMKKAEKELGISFDKDVVPWMGQTGIVFLGMSGRDPQIAIIAEIKDKDAFARCAKQVQSFAERESGKKWIDFTYHGVKLRKLSISIEYRPPTTFTSGVLPGWFILGIGSGAAEKVIDVTQGRVPSLKHNTEWVQAMSKLPSKRVAWLGCDGTRMTDIMDEANNVMGIPSSSKWDSIRHVRKKQNSSASSMFNGFAVYVFSEKGNELRADAEVILRSEAARKLYQKLKKSSKPITGKSLAKLPEGTFAAILVSNPGPWLDVYKQTMLDSCQTQEMRFNAERFFLIMTPIENAIDTCTGECAAGLIWRKEKGFGLTIAGETAGKDIARNSALSIQALLQGFGMPVKQDGNLSILPALKHDEENIHVLPCWGFDDKWLALSTHPDLITSSKKATLKLPSDAAGADMVAFGKFSFLPSMLNWAKENAGSARDREAIDLIRQLGLDKAEWAMWSKTDPQGTSVHTTAVLRNWEWRKALKTAMDFAAKQAD